MNKIVLGVVVAMVSGSVIADEWKAVKISTCYTVNSSVVGQTEGGDQAVAGLHVLNGLTDVTGPKPMPKTMIQELP